MPPPSPLHRHQSSLESVIDFSTEPPFRTDQRTEAKRRFYRVVEHFESADNSSSSRSRYDRPRLVRFTYELAVSDESRDNFLRAFFRAVALSIEGEEYIDFEKLRSAFFGFADHLLDNFFLPRKAGWVGYPFVPPLLMSLSEGFHQKDPAALTRIPLCSGGGAEGAQGFVGTPDRVSALRGACLVRDRHRCVISRRFDYNEAIRRLSGSSDARDDDGSLLLEDEKPFESLEVAHVLPHSLTKLDANSQLDPSKQAALAILNMFDSGVTHLIEGTSIDQPRNAITLTHTLHQGFGDFQIFFEATDQPHTYRISSFLPVGVIRDPPFPIIRTLYLTDTRTVDPPSPRLLAIHRAIAHILHLSGAGYYIDKLLQDMEDKGVQADGSTELERLLKLGLGGWLDGTIYA